MPLQFELNHEAHTKKFVFRIPVSKTGRKEANSNFENRIPKRISPTNPNPVHSLPIPNFSPLTPLPQFPSSNLRIHANRGTASFNFFGATPYNRNCSISALSNTYYPMSIILFIVHMLYILIIFFIYFFESVKYFKFQVQKICTEDIY